jgi:hypothetical protein
MNKKIALLFALVLAISSPSAFAQGASIGTMFANGTATFVAMIKLIQYSSYLIGIFLVLGSIFKFSQLGSNPQMTAKIPLTMFFVGVAIFALTGTLNVVGQTMAMGNGPGAALLPATSGTAGIQAAMTGVLTFMRLVGYIAFIRGWLMLNAAGQGKEGMINRGLTHIVGGMACIHIDIFARMIAATFIPGIPLSAIGL